MSATRRSIRCGALALLALPASGPAFSASATDRPGAAAKTATLADVVVTARKREETLSDVPVAVTAYTAEALDRLNVEDLGDLDALVPNLTVYAARGSSSTITAYLRGVGQSDPLWGVDPGVGVYLDDVYIARPQGALLDVFDVQRIEVLRGPQGSLYGKNTIGGAIKYISAPLENARSGRSAITLGSCSQFDLKTRLNQPLGRGWVARLALAALGRDGFGENRRTQQAVSDKEILAGRLSLGYRTDTLSLLLSLDRLDDQSGVRGARMLAANRFAPGTLPLADRYDVRNGLDNVNDTTLEGTALTVTWRLNDDIELKSVSAYRRSGSTSFLDFDTLPDRILDSKAYYADQQRSQELQLNFDAGGDWRGVAGLYAFDGVAQGRVLGNFFNRTFGSTEGAVDTASLALYGEGSYAFAPAWNLTAGLRYTRERKTADVFNYSFVDGSFSVPNGLVSADFEDSATFSAASPKLSLDVQASASWLLYGLLSRGFKSGGFNIRANTSAVPASAHPFDDEQVTSIEIGAKGALLDDRLFLNIAGFHNIYRDIQLSVASAYDADGDGIDDAFFGDFTNAGRGTVDGIEIEYQWSDDSGFGLQGNLAWLDARYDDYLDRGINVADQRRFTNAPRFSAQISGRYAFTLTGGGSLTPRLSYNRQSEVYPTTDLSPVIRQKAYGLLSAGIYWQTRGAWRYALEGNNLTDRAYRTTGYNFPVFGVLTGFYGAPRTISFTAVYAFD